MCFGHEFKEGGESTFQENYFWKRKPNSSLNYSITGRSLPRIECSTTQAASKSTWATFTSSWGSMRRPSSSTGWHWIRLDYDDYNDNDSDVDDYGDGADDDDDDHL